MRFIDVVAGFCAYEKGETMALGCPRAYGNSMKAALQMSRQVIPQNETRVHRRIFEHTVSTIGWGGSQNRNFIVQAFEVVTSTAWPVTSWC
ncbi:MAG: hypothetical protein ACLUKN_02125 [Bacilli bacterium]